MNIAIITGSCGLIGREAAGYFAAKGFKIVGIDNDMRAKFFGAEASTRSSLRELRQISGYEHHDIDIRDAQALGNIFRMYGQDIRLVIHTAAQPSHDWAAQDPLTDFAVNADATLGLLELCRRQSPGSVFIFTSTNKVYGDTPNRLPFKELATRWDIPEHHPYFEGIDEAMSIDGSKHSLFGVSKTAADLMVQEYGRYFGLKTVVFRAGCLTGPHHAGARQHGFLSYLMKCVLNGEDYMVFGYQGKQVRDHIHCHDVVTAFDAFYQNPQCGSVFNLGGGRPNSCSVIEAIDLCERIASKKLRVTYQDQPRQGDHQWYISSMAKFQSQYPQWCLQYSLKTILEDIFAAQK